jgi:hypothetical protein
MTKVSALPTIQGLTPIEILVASWDVMLSHTFLYENTKISGNLFKSIANPKIEEQYDNPRRVP